MRAGLSAISIEKDKLVSSEKKYKEARQQVEDAQKEYQGLKRRESSFGQEKEYAPVEDCDRVKSLNAKIEHLKKEKFSFPKFFVPIAVCFFIGAFFTFILASSNVLELIPGASFFRPEYPVIFLTVIGILIGSISTGKHADKKKKKIAKVYKEIDDVKKAIQNARDRENVKEKKQYDYLKSEQTATLAKIEKLKKVVDDTLPVYQNNLSLLPKMSKEMYDRLVNQFKSVLDVRDWEHIDLIIFNFETGRADTLKESLQQVDRRVQTDEIIDAVGKAAQSLSGTIRATMNELRGDLDRSFAKLSSQLDSQHQAQMAALDGIGKNIDAVSGNISKLQATGEKNNAVMEQFVSETNLNNALLAKINSNSISLMKDVNYMVYTVA
ncbi:MAG TPA: hypothetical protein DEV87_01660 [Clostridiales bacterium]|nr:hypothetical protein [Clostridiales bacterium]